MQFLVVPKITNELPSYKVDISSWNIPTTITLADPFFYQPGQVDMLLGAHVFFELLHAGRITLHDNLPVLQNTVFGWIISGPCTNPAPQGITSCHVQVDSTDHQLQLQNQMAKFWDVEDFHSSVKPRTPQEVKCEQIFIETTERDDTGRFSVRLPFKDDSPTLGEYMVMAERRFLQLERRLTANSKLREMYSDFIHEYISLGHMEEVDPTKMSSTAVYLPHHGVLKETSSTTKLRVVFDASAKTSSGKSLNEALLVGPKIQDDLIDIVMRFRTHLVVITGDIAKMYRQVNVNESDQDFQRILWRDNPQEKLRHYRLKTVTYGTASAPFLATRCLQQLATDEARRFPRASQAALSDFYVDDILTGAQSIDEAISLRQELSELLSAGNFPLRKWSSNCVQVLADIPTNEREVQDPLLLDDKETVGILGLKWIPSSDQFCFNVGSFHNVNTKRTILSDVSKLFDPLGLLGPIIIIAKVLMQEIWQLQLSWDDPVPESINLKWNDYKMSILDVSQVHINRCAITISPPYTIKVIGFSDASEIAYGAAVYVVASNASGEVSSHLLCAKSRVAPLKRLTIPRLELCGALLLAELIEKVSKTIQIDTNDVRAFTDSMIVLYWIHGDPCKQKTFVGNRVAQIKGIIQQSAWAHVKSGDNPADLISRGCAPSDLANNSLWWHGPSWITEIDTYDKHVSNLNDQILQPDDFHTAQSEMKNLIISSTTLFEENNLVNELLDKFSSLTKIQRIMAYCLRFASNIKRTTGQSDEPNLTTLELTKALEFIVRNVQQAEFNKEIQALRKKQQIHAKSKLLSLNPFLDDDGVLRVGGRLARSDYRYEMKFPALLPAKHRLTQLLFEREHTRLLHIGPQGLLANIRLKFWPLSGRDLARQVTHKCISCFRNRVTPESQLMGQLPVTRITPVRPFLHCGVDYGGPIMTIRHKGRLSKSNVLEKSYIALFVCFWTKAVHIEIVSDLSTEAFIAAFRRFTSRRGKCASITSDNGTNFVGADHELQRLVKSKPHNRTVTDFLSTEGIQWKFIPPGAPHMGGLWEAGIKSTKHHIRRVTTQNSYYTYEELSTLTTQIEACLNSRPLTQISNDPNDYTALTPGHFLIGAPLMSLPDPDYTQTPDNRLKKFKLIQKQVQVFWKRYIGEYVTSLQNRSKWKTSSQNLKKDDMVLVRDDNTPPTQWILGRIIHVVRGPDGLVRVTTIRTSKGVICRNVVKLCKLPIDGDTS